MAIILTAVARNTYFQTVSNYAISISLSIVKPRLEITMMKTRKKNIFMTKGMMTIEEKRDKSEKGKKRKKALSKIIYLENKVRTLYFFNQDF